MPGSVASARLTLPPIAAGTHSATRSSGTPSTVRTERLCSASVGVAVSFVVAASAGLASRAARPSAEASAGEAWRYPNSTTRRLITLPDSVTAEPAWRKVPSASVWWNEPPAANQPEPWRLSTSPCSRNNSSARRTVTRLTAYRVHRADSLSRAPWPPYSPRATRSRRSSAIWRNRELVINLYTTSLTPLRPLSVSYTHLTLPTNRE